MCSIGEDDFGDEGGVHAMVPDIKSNKVCQLIDESSLLNLCHKCRKPGAIYKLPFRQAECCDCFLLYTRHKFRAALGSSKVLPKDAKVILIFDGSAASMVLLDMLHHAQTQNSFKRLHCTATILYIDDFELLEQNCGSDQYKRFLVKFKTFLEKYTHFESFIVPLVDIVDVPNCVTNIKSTEVQQYHLQHKKEKQSLQKSIDSIKSLTSRQEFVKYHRSKLIATIASQFKCNYAFMPDVSPDLACGLLAAVALGRGGSAALDVAFVDDRLGNDVKLIRPLKDLNTTEIDLYLKAQNLEVLQTKSFGLEAGPSASIQNLTKSFVNNLQQNFSSTVSTVFRTGDKIAVNQDVVKDFQKLDLTDSGNLKIRDKYCKFCNSVLDYHDSKTLLAIEFSRLVSESGCTLTKCINLNAKAKENVQGSIEKTCFKDLCHACRNIYMETSNESILT